MKHQPNILKLIILIAIISAVITGCSKETPVSAPDPTTTGSIVLEFDNIAGDRQLELNSTVPYQNALGEKFSVTTFSYYISNIKLQTATGETYTVPQDSSYFLIKESDAASQKIILRNVPSLDYTSVSFTIGVDSIRNTMDIAKRTGVLDPANGMYWSWNSGYIFVKAEGSSASSSNGSFRYHIGGFGGITSQTINNIKSIIVPFGNSAATVRPTVKPEVHLLVDVLKIFNGTANVSITSNPTVMFTPYSTTIANNYRGMFSVDHVHND